MEEKILRLKETWNNIGIPLRIKQKLLEIGQPINEKAYWRVIEHLIRKNEEFQKFRQSKDFKEILDMGARKEENEFFKEVKKVNVNLRTLTSVLDEKLNEAIKK